MKIINKNILFLLILIQLSQATFSIIAVDRETGEVGSAGGSCIANSIIISDMHPGVGVIHTQSYWNSSNQDYASTLMDNNYSPNEIINLLEENDVQNNPSIRQYGIVDLFNEYDYGQLYEDECNEIEGAIWYNLSESELGNCLSETVPRSASFTGNNCSNWRGHINGIDYAIQGNILLNEDILTNMETSFLNTNGPLDRKLMNALHGAKVPGADTRCLDEGISTLSAFIRVAKSDDSDNYYIDLNIPTVSTHFSQTGEWIDPIDTLNTLYENWYTTDFLYEMGDINQDFLIDILDIIKMINYILGGNINGLEYYLSDLNDDNIINIQDVIIINIILN